MQVEYSTTPPGRVNAMDLRSSASCPRGTPSPELIGLPAYDPTLATQSPLGGARRVDEHPVEQRPVGEHPAVTRHDQHVGVSRAVEVPQQRPYAVLVAIHGHDATAILHEIRGVCGLSTRGGTHVENAFIGARAEKRSGHSGGSLLYVEQAEPVLDGVRYAVRALHDPREVGQTLHGLQNEALVPKPPGEVVERGAAGPDSDGGRIARDDGGLKAIPFRNDGSVSLERHCGGPSVVSRKYAGIDLASLDRLAVCSALDLEQGRRSAREPLHPPFGPLGASPYFRDATLAVHGPWGALGADRGRRRSPSTPPDPKAEEHEYHENCGRHQGPIRVGLHLPVEVQHAERRSDVGEAVESLPTLAQPSDPSLGRRHGQGNQENPGGESHDDVPPLARSGPRV